MITEDYVSFETAKLLKEKGFEGCSIITTYDKDAANAYIKVLQEKHLPYSSDDPKLKEFYYTMPTLQMACKWLRKNHQIFIRPNTSFLYPIKWYSEIFCYGDNLKTQQDIKTEYYDSPEESYEAAIKYCLENLI